MSIGIAGQKIITGGLGVNHRACDGIITTHFSLYCKDIIIPPERPPTGGGGPYPGRAWNKFDSAWDIFKPVNDNYDPAKAYKQKKVVEFKMKFNGKTIERTYLIPLNRANMVVKVIHIMNASAKHYKLAVSSVHRVLRGIGVNITNFRKRK